MTAGSAEADDGGHGTQAMKMGRLGADFGSTFSFWGNDRGVPVAETRTSGWLGVKEQAFLNKFRQTRCVGWEVAGRGVGWVGVGVEGALVVGRTGRVGSVQKTGSLAAASGWA